MCIALAALVAVVLWLPAPPRAASAGARGAPAGPLPQLDDAGRLRPVADPASVGLREERVRGRTVWAQAGVPAAKVGWAVDAWDAAAGLVPPATGLAPPREPAALYLFADGDSFRRLTSELTGLAPGAIHTFEGGRSYAAGARRGIYLNAGAIASLEQAARLVAHELVHLAERDLVGSRAIPRWFSEGLAEQVSQRAMASVNAHSAAERRWRRAAVVASGLHRNTAFPLSALTTPAQWSDAAAAGYDRFIYAEALLAVDWLLGRSGRDSPGRILGEVAGDASFAAAFERVVGVPLGGLDANVDSALRADLLPRFPVGIHAFEAAGPPGTRFQFAVVGLSPSEVLTREFVREDGHPARDPGAPGVVSPAGVAFWTFQTRPDSEPATWWMTVQGDQGTWARLAFKVTPAADAPVGP